jgi:hypothetical protein
LPYSAAKISGAGLTQGCKVNILKISGFIPRFLTFCNLSKLKVNPSFFALYLNILHSKPC